MKEQQGIEPMAHRLQQARSQVGMTQEEAAQRLGVTQAYLSLLEAGKRRPNLKMLAKVSEVFGRPIRWFHSMDEPTGTFVLLLRKGETLSSESRKGLVQFCHLCEETAWLRQVLNRPLPELPLYQIRPQRGEKIDHLAKALASAERGRLGLGDDPVPNLMTLLEAQGVPVVRLPMPQGELAGAMAYDADKGAFILVNANDPTSRQIWTAAHEYGHLIKDREQGFTLDQDISENGNGDSSKDETWFAEHFAHRFAAHFLMPEGTLRRLIEGVWEGQLNEWTLIELRRTFGVSYEALRIQLERLGYMTQESSQRWAGMPLPKIEQVIFGKPTEPPVPSPSALLWELALQAALKGEVTASRCAEMLDVSPAEIQDILFELEGAEAGGTAP